MRSFSFWSIKPELVVINVAEDNMALADAFAREAGLTEPVMGICCKIEAELAGAGPEYVEGPRVVFPTDNVTFESVPVEVVTVESVTIEDSAAQSDDEFLDAPGAEQER